MTTVARLFPPAPEPWPGYYGIPFLSIPDEQRFDELSRTGQFDVARAACRRMLPLLAMPRFHAQQIAIAGSEVLRNHILSRLDRLLALVEGTSPIEDEYRRLRAAVAEWDPRESLPAEVTRHARSCAYLEGIREPAGGWDSAEGPGALANDPRQPRIDEAMRAYGQFLAVAQETRALVGAAPSGGRPVRFLEALDTHRDALASIEAIRFGVGDPLGEELTRRPLLAEMRAYAASWDGMDLGDAALAESIRRYLAANKLGD